MSSAASRALLSPTASDTAPATAVDHWFAALLFTLAAACIGVCRVYAPPALAKWFRPLPFHSPADLFLLLAAGGLAMLVHEAGHFLASQLLGFSFLGASFGPIRAQTLHGRWKISIDRKAFFTASVSAVPGSMRFWRPAVMIVVTCGPIATISAVCASTGFQMNSPSAALFQLAFVQVSLLIFVLGFIPNSSRAQTPNDCRLFIDLALKRPGAQEMELAIALTQFELRGIPPGDYPLDLLRRLAACRGRAESQLTFAQALVRWALDSEDVDLASQWDLRALALSEFSKPKMQNSALAASACFDVIYRQDLESAWNKFARVDFDALFPRCFEERARAAWQISLDRNHRAIAHILRAQFSLPQAIASSRLERAMLEKIHMRVLSSRLPRNRQAASA